MIDCEIYSNSGGGAAWADLSGCVLSNNTTTSWGAGCCYGTAEDCFIVGNVADGSGGGSYFADLSACALIGNTAGSSGGGALGGTLTDCFLSENVATGAGGGGASGSTLIGCTIERCRAVTGGGCSSTTAENCTIAENQATSYGGGAWCGTLTGCQLVNNTADSDGGGVYSQEYGQFATLTRCLISGNSAGRNGGGNYGAKTVLTNCVITANSAADTGGGAYQGKMTHCSVSANVAESVGGVRGGELLNCVVSGNVAASGPSDMQFSNMEACCCPEALHGVDQCITNAPKFADTMLRLRYGSPGIDAAVTVADLNEDYDGIARSMDGDSNGVGVSDMGAHEFASRVADTDGDGLSDWDEVCTHRTLPTESDSDGDGQSDGSEVAGGTLPTVNESVAGLYTASTIQDLRMGGLIGQVQDSKFKVGLQLQQTDNLEAGNWDDVGSAVQWEITPADGKQFFRVRGQ